MYAISEKSFKNNFNEIKVGCFENGINEKIQFSVESCLDGGGGRFMMISSASLDLMFRTLFNSMALCILRI